MDTPSLEAALSSFSQTIEALNLSGSRGITTIGANNNGGSGSSNDPPPLELAELTDLDLSHTDLTSRGSCLALVNQSLESSFTR